MYDYYISNTKLCVYHFGKLQQESNNLSLLKNPKDVIYHSFQYNKCKNKDFFSSSNLLVLLSTYFFVKEVKPFKAFSSKSYSKLLLTAFASRYYRKVPVDKSNKGFSCNQPIDQL